MKKEILLLSISLGFAFGVECKNYIVKEGDTLERIARQEGVDLNRLKSANRGIRENNLQVGQKLCIPVNTSGKSSTQKYAIYRVKKGDTLSKIAESFGIDSKTLMEFNNLKDEKLVEGQELKIPARGQQSQKQSVQDRGEVYYTVKRSGRLEDVARVTGVPLKELERLNPDLKGKTLKEGTKVRLPEGKTAQKGKEDITRKVDYDVYTVKRGGKLEHISASAGVPLAELERLNPELKGKWLKPGTQVKVPKRAMDSRMAGKGERYETYTVRRGARLEHVAKATGIPIRELEKLNPDLKDKWLPAGTQVKIPLREKPQQESYTKDDSYPTYTVKRSARLKDVAKVTGIPLQELEKLNPELRGRMLREGTKVRLPKIETASSAKSQKEQAPSRKEERQIVSELPQENPPAQTTTPRGLSIPMPIEGKVVRVPKGIEISAPCSAPIRAVEDGRVIYSGGDLQAYGNMVIVEHESFISLYAYNEVNLVRRGERVSKGQTIARVGKKSNSEECLLRFELRNKEGSPLDPTEYIRDIQ